jgi:phage repressor protein C with HTH and peptisase S24 domain
LELRNTKLRKTVNLNLEKEFLLMDAAKIIDAAVSSTGLSMEALAERLGIKERTLKRIRSGEYELSEPVQRHIETLIALYIANPKLGNAAQPETSSIREEAWSYRVQNARMVPVLSFAQAGQPSIFEELPPDWQETMPTDCPDQKAFGLTLRGDSMTPRFVDGSQIVVMPGHSPYNGCLCVAMLQDGSVNFKIYHRSGSQITLTSYNHQMYPEMKHHAKDFRWIWPVYAVSQNVWK